MNQEDRQLLLKDLAQRLPYGVKGIITYNGDKNIFTIKGIYNILFPISVICAFFVGGFICASLQIWYEFKGQCSPNVNKFGVILIFVFSIIIWIVSYIIFNV